MLCDTGPLVALLDENDPAHLECVDILSNFPSGPLYTTWPCVAEAMYLLHRNFGFPAQEALWNMIDNGRVSLSALENRDVINMRDLMRLYRDTPMDLADASLVAVAERLKTKRIFTLDRHFHVYRFKGKHAFEVLP
jgi:predicted nucleic acid-binding protein